MDKQSLLEALNKAKEGKSRNFSQSIDLIINIKDIDLKKTENQVDFFMQLPSGTGKKIKVCAFVDTELIEEAKANCEEVITVEDFQKFGKNKKLAKKLARKYDYFIAQATIMPKVASFFGPSLGPKGKMPNPKAGCVVLPKANLKAVKDNLEKTIRVSARTAPVIMCKAGTEQMPPEKVAENISAIYERILHALPNEEANIKSAFIKLTMSPSVKIK